MGTPSRGLATGDGMKGKPTGSGPEAKPASPRQTISTESARLMTSALSHHIGHENGAADRARLRDRFAVVPDAPRERWCDEDDEQSRDAGPRHDNTRSSVKSVGGFSQLRTIAVHVPWWPSWSSKWKASGTLSGVS